jgi:small subunit ribosomal protein S8
MNYVINNCVGQLRNGIQNKKEFIIIKKSKKMYSFLDFLIKQRFILNYNIQKSKLFIALRYDVCGELVLKNILLVSKKTRFIFIKYKLLFYLKNLAIHYILLTNQGYMTHFLAKEKKIGGTIVCIIL